MSAVNAGGLPSTSERVHINGHLAAGPGAADADTSHAFASVDRPCKVLQVFVFPSANIALNADLSTITLQSGATVIASGTNAAAITAAAGIELTLVAAQQIRAAGDVLSIKVDNDAVGAEDLSGVSFNIDVVAQPN
jgi:hypothetical protein